MTSTIMHSIADLVPPIGKARTSADIHEALRTATSVIGATFYHLELRGGRTSDPPERVLLSSLPQKWKRGYDSNEWATVDPVYRQIQITTNNYAFRWDELYRSPKQQELQAFAASCNMQYGFSVVDHAPSASLASLSFCGNRPITQHPEQWEITAYATSVLAWALHRAMIRLLLTRSDRLMTHRKPLSENELTALRLTASGMTAVRVGAAMGRSPQTVRYYLDQAAEKLNVTSRKQAVLKAVSTGLVDTRRFEPLSFSAFEAQSGLDD